MPGLQDPQGRDRDHDGLRAGDLIPTGQSVAQAVDIT
jgi:hypothetical protein